MDMMADNFLVRTDCEVRMHCNNFDLSPVPEGECVPAPAIDPTESEREAALAVMVRQCEATGAPSTPPQGYRSLSAGREIGWQKVCQRLPTEEALAKQLLDEYCAGA